MRLRTQLVLRLFLLPREWTREEKQIERMREDPGESQTSIRVYDRIGGAQRNIPRRERERDKDVNRLEGEGYRNEGFQSKRRGVWSLSIQNGGGRDFTIYSFLGLLCIETSIYHIYIWIYLFYWCKLIWFCWKPEWDTSGRTISRWFTCSNKNG